MINFRVTNIFLQLPLLALMLCPFPTSGQQDLETRSIFDKAESYYLFYEYELANPLYLMLETPDNLNIKYKIGTCYLNITGEKAKAIPYLEDAVRDASYDAKSTTLKEKRAPLDAYFFLGKAYMINNDLDKAVNTFQTFSNLAQKTEPQGGMRNFDYIDQQIKACKNAIYYQANPIRLTKSALEETINQGSINENPAVSYDGNSMVYTERRGMVNVLFFSKREKGKWQTPVEITESLNAGTDCSSCSLNSDGTKLFLYKNDTFDGNIYSSDFVNGRWMPIRKLNRNINTKFFESHASVSADGKKLYFTSNRDGGAGALDIYVSALDASGDWGPAVNLGPMINTPFNEETPFVTKNDSMLYFSSEGHSTIGGYDVFCSLKSESDWKAPQNMGYPVNTTDDDRFFQPFNNGKNAFYSMQTDYKRKDIFYLDLTNQFYEIKGKYSLNDTILTFDEKYLIHLLNSITGDTVDVGFPNKYTGLYSFMVSHGAFKIVYTGHGYFSQTVDTAIVENSSSNVMIINVTLKRDPSVPRKIKKYDKIDLSNIPEVSSVDSSILVSNVNINDVDDKNVKDSEILYYTVQVMALYNPVDISYFKYINDVKVMYNENDRFYRYTTGQFQTKEEAYSHKKELLSIGYPDDLFVKKVSKNTNEKSVSSQKFYTIQLKATRIPVDVRIVFRRYEGVRESKESDGLYHYFYGRYNSLSEARSDLLRIQKEDFKDAFIKPVNPLVNK